MPLAILRQLEFLDQQSTTTLDLRIRDDRLPELDEITRVTLTSVLEPGTRLTSRGATLGTQTSCTLTVLANDSPYGVLAWTASNVTALEPPSFGQWPSCIDLLRQ